MPVGGEEKARAFFGRIIGMREEAKPGPLASRGGCWFRLGGVILHLGVEKDFSPQRKAHPAFCAADLNLLGKRLEEAAFPVEWDDSLPDRKRFYTSDPFGNRIDGDGFGQKG